MKNKSGSENQPLTIDGIINEIKEKSADGDYIYRGERKRYPKISSAFYRECAKIDFELFDLRDAQKEMLNTVKKHLGGQLKSGNESFAELMGGSRFLSEDQLEILTELQHYGGKTNLIDFTTDYLIAIFFACAGYPDKDGRVILLQKTEEIENEMLIRPLNPRHRVIAQKSIFLNHPRGFIDVPEDKVVIIPTKLKQELLEYLGKFHDISTETIYNDIHGFIRYQNIHQNAYIAFSLGLTFQYRGIKAETPEVRQMEHEEAIKHYNRSIEMDPNNVTIINRAECWLHLGEWDKAREDFLTGEKMGGGIIRSFRNAYKNVSEFEEKTGYEVPKDIAEMLGG